MARLEDACSTSLVLSFELALAPWPVRTRTRLITFSESSTFTSKVKTRFMREGMELWTSFILPRRLNTKSLFCEGGELADISRTVIQVMTEGLGCSSFFNLWKTNGFRVLLFPILAKHRRAGKALARCWRLQPIEHRCFWIGLSIFTLIIINLFSYDILYEGLLVFTSSQNPYRLGWYVTKANFRHCNAAPLTLYDLLHAIKVIGPSFDYMPQRCWLTKS